jgi:biotin transport system substrate-specific component
MTVSRVLSGFGSREIVTNRTLCKGIGVISFIILTAFGAFLKIPLPFTPVPVTLQTFFVLLSGAILGRRLGSLSQASYLLLGGVGLPLFADPRGLGGPTGGYLIGFLFASWVVGRLVSFGGGKNIFWIIFIMLSGSVLIYSLGCLQLASVIQCGIKKALLLGVLPFIPGDFLKLLGAAFVYKRFGKRFQKIFMV